MALRIGSSQNRNLYVGTGTEVAVSDGNAIVTGNVGIGTTSPNAPLEIFQGGSGKVTLLQLARPNTAGLQSNIQFTVGSNIMVGQIQHEYAGANFNHMSFTLRAVNGNDIIPLWLENSGKVGIGTTSPNGKLTILEAQGTNKGDFDFQQIVYNGGWSANVDGLAAIQWSDGVGSSNTVGRIGVTYTGSQGEFQIKDLFNGGYAGSGKVFTVRGDGQAYFSGKVGIGTTSPGNMLDVAGDTDITGQLVVNHDSNYVVKINQQATSMSNGSYTFEVNSSTHTSNMSTAGAMAVDVNSGRAFTINGLGKVGIATINPDKDLTVGGTGPTHGINLRTKSGSNEWLLWQVEQFFSQEGYMRLFYDNVAKIQFRANGDSYFVGGNVGIGTTSPDSKLDVTGGDITVNTNSVGFMTFKYGTAGSESTMGSIQTTGIDLKINATSDLLLLPGSNVGIGTTNPDNKLDVVVSDVNVVPNGESSAVFRRNGNNYLTILSNASNEGGILFGNAGDANDGAISYEHNNQSMQIYTADTERIRINSSGTVGIGPTGAFTNNNILNLSGTGIAIKNDTNGSSNNWSQIKNTSTASGSNLVFLTATGTNIMDDAGRLGIGTTNPTSKLEISGFPTAQGLRLNYGNSSGTVEAINFQANGGANGVIGMQMVSSNVGDLWLGGSGGRTLTLYRNGNVGIGTTVPAAKLDVEDGHIRNTNDSSGDFLDIFCDGDGTGESIISSSSNNIVIRPASGFLDVRANGFGNSGSHGNLQISNSANAVQVRLNSSGDSYLNGGDVGIGITNPSSKLEVAGYIKTSDGNKGAAAYTFTTAADTGMFRDGGALAFTVGGTQTVSINAGTMGVAGSLIVGTTASIPSGVKFKVDGVSLIEDSPGVADFYLGSYAGTNHFRFHTNNSDTYFDMNCGNLYWRDGGSTRYTFFPSTANMTVNGTITQNSDIRVKENIIEIGDCIGKVQAMRGVYYNRTDFNTEATKVGVIAQEVEAVLPELIVESPEDGLKSVAYSELTAVLINAIKEQQEIIEDLKTRVKQLEINN